MLTKEDNIVKDELLSFLYAVDTPAKLQEVSDKTGIDIDVCNFLLTQMNLAGHIKFERIGSDKYASVAWITTLGKGFLKKGGYSEQSLREKALKNHPNPKPKSHIAINKIASLIEIIAKHPLWSAVIAGIILLAISHFIFGTP